MEQSKIRILGIAPYDGMRTAMERAAEAYPQIQLDAYTGDLEAGVAIVQQTPPNTYHWRHFPRRHSGIDPQSDRFAGGGYQHFGL